MIQLSKAALDGLVGKSITDICENHFDSPTQNHCAHFVSHVLGLKVGMLCGDMEFKTKGTGASIRCDELYNGIPVRGAWAKAPGITDGLLVFVTSAANVTNNIMASVPQKHVGIVFGGAVYNFGNTQHQVRKEQTVQAFHQRLSGAYRGDDISLYFAAPI